MEKITVVNIREMDLPLSEDVIYVGRKNKSRGLDASPLKSTFPLTKYSRAQSIAEYRKWLWAKIVSEDVAVAEELAAIIWKLKKYGEIRLACWCAPKACHGDVIASCIQWMMAS